MINPWLKIPHKDYEDHMLYVGQAQILNALVKACLSKYSPKSFALLGCATGNGLEHVSSFTRNAYAIDINPNYLAIVQEKFAEKINIKTIRNDVQNEKLPLENIHLFFIGLVLEYVDPIKALSNVLETLSEDGTLVTVIQKCNPSCFVSRTPYKTLEQLNAISNEVDEALVITYLKNKNLELVKRKEIQVSTNKIFKVFEFTRSIH